MAASTSGLGILTFELLNHDLRVTILRLLCWEKVVPPVKVLEDEMKWGRERGAKGTETPVPPTCCGNDQRITMKSSPSQISDPPNFEQIKMIVLGHEMLV